VRRSGVSPGVPNPPAGLLPLFGSCSLPTPLPVPVKVDPAAGSGWEWLLAPVGAREPISQMPTEGLASQRQRKPFMLPLQHGAEEWTEQVTTLCRRPQMRWA